MRLVVARRRRFASVLADEDKICRHAADDCRRGRESACSDSSAGPLGRI